MYIFWQPAGRTPPHSCKKTLVTNGTTANLNLPARWLDDWCFQNIRRELFWITVPQKEVNILKYIMFDTLPMQLLSIINFSFNSFEYSDKHMDIANWIKVRKSRSSQIRIHATETLPQLWTILIILTEQVWVGKQVLQEEPYWIWT